MANKSVAHKWKTKMIPLINLGTDTGKMAHAMICMNSNPEFSRYPDAAPDDGVCDQWVYTNQDTASVLCSNCVQRLMQRSPNRVDTNEIDD